MLKDLLAYEETISSGLRVDYIAYPLGCLKSSNLRVYNFSNGQSKS